MNNNNNNNNNSNNNRQKKPRFVYEYLNEQYEVPSHFIYQVHAGGYDISEAFFTWAFNKHEISIIDIKILHTSENRQPKGDKSSTAASSTFFIASVTGRDKRKVEKVGDGESGAESITNFQRGYPAGLAIKRAKVNMGKEFFNLVDLKLAKDCRDTVVEFGQEKGKTIEEISRTAQGMNTISWMASESFTGDGVIKLKATEFIEKHGKGVQPTNNGVFNGGNAQQTQPNVQQTQPNVQQQPNNQQSGIYQPQVSQNNTYQQPNNVAQQGVGNPQQVAQTPTQQPQGAVYQPQVANGQQGASYQPQGATANSQPVTQPTMALMTQQQWDIVQQYRKKKFVTDQQLGEITNTAFNGSFNWQGALFEQVNIIINSLQQKYGSL